MPVPTTANDQPGIVVADEEARVELAIFIIVPLVLAAAVAFALSRRDRRRWNPGASSEGDGGRAYRNAMGEAGNARNTWSGGAGGL